MTELIFACPMLSAMALVAIALALGAVMETRKNRLPAIIRRDGLRHRSR